MTIKDATTVGSHLSELSSSKRIILLSEHVGKLNMFSKATPTISGYCTGRYKLLRLHDKRLHQARNS